MLQQLTWECRNSSCPLGLLVPLSSVRVWSWLVLAVLSTKAEPV
jgi:hypothetical protein